MRLFECELVWNAITMAAVFTYAYAMPLINL